MNLILQGLTTQRGVIEQIASLARPRLIAAIDEHTYRCEDISYNDEVKAQIDVAAWAAQLDYAFLDRKRALSDFKLLVMDMDSTLITIECIDEIADMQGLKPQVAEITEAAMRGEIEFRESLLRRVALLEGLDASALQRVYDERMKLSPGAETMLRAVKAAGLKTLLVSGGFTFFTDRIRERLGLDFAHANRLEIAGGKLTGRVEGGIVDAEEKMRTVERICQEMNIPVAQTIIMGDGANDLKMMNIAGLSVA
ncbi:MAG TPA: phosphoserine phosphatase SerB, partial [Oxalicibacterium sp.]|nr:phosphoserine phosphatase SerB [Oxalicibacterium sp.]